MRPSTTLLTSITSRIVGSDRNTAFDCKTSQYESYPTNPGSSCGTSRSKRRLISLLSVFRISRFSAIEIASNTSKYVGCTGNSRTNSPSGRGFWPSVQGFWKAGVRTQHKPHPVGRYEVVQIDL